MISLKSSGNHYKRDDYYFLLDIIEDGIIRNTDTTCKFSISELCKSCNHKRACSDLRYLINFLYEKSEEPNTK